jgi:hypothetical protein
VQLGPRGTLGPRARARARGSARVDRGDGGSYAPSARRRRTRPGAAAPRKSHLGWHHRVEESRRHL